MTIRYVHELIAALAAEDPGLLVQIRFEDTLGPVAGYDIAPVLERDELGGSVVIRALVPRNVTPVEPPQP